MLSVSITILTVLLVIVSLLMILIVLMQRPKQEGLGAAFGGGMMNDIAGAHTTDILQKGTVWLAVMFFSISILLGFLYTRQIAQNSSSGVLDAVKTEQPAPTPTSPPSISDFAPAGVAEMPEDTPPPAADGEEAKENEGEEKEGAEESPESSGEQAPATSVPGGDTREESPNPAGGEPEEPGDDGEAGGKPAENGEPQ